jgi:mono/diheme cytochrome c family protein
MSALKSLLLASFVALPAVLLFSASHRPSTLEGDPVSRGRYLVALGSCSDCHTPLKLGPNGPEPDMTRYLAGHPGDANLPAPPALPPGPWFAMTAGMTAWAGPWGVSYAANLTPDEQTGMGIWTEDMFIRTLRTGKHFGVSRDILPPMPWQNLSQLTAEDLKAIFAFLRTVTPISSRVPEPTPPGGGTNPFE